jgi:hypothetical protein
MSIETHEGVVAFKLLSSGRQQILLGAVSVGEISPSMNPRSQFPVCFRIELPDSSSRAWQPARDVTDARRQALEKINDWMIAAGLRPTGASN